MKAKLLEIKDYLLNFQNKICHLLQAEEAESSFIKDTWSYDGGEGGLTCVLSKGTHIEKAGVNFSHVLGQSLPPSATLARPELANKTFQAMGVSIVIHPVNPYIPTTHANIRFVRVDKNNTEPHWWFGGGFDLTPYYGFAEDCIHWHKTAKKACDPFGREVYDSYKKWCDQYFYLKHRKEPRGIGGLFFDDLNEWGFEKCFAFMQSIGNHFIDAYFPIFKKRKNHAFTQKQIDFQRYRRGRYVEFNLLYDRGTLFGIQSGGQSRIDSYVITASCRLEI